MPDAKRLWWLCSMLVVAISGAEAQQRRSREAFVGKLVPCRVAGVEQEVLCGKREVLENRSAGTGRTIALNIVVLPATTDSVVDDAVVFLAGGGVVPATRYARFLGTAIPGDFRTPFRSATPALLLTGELDPVTPPAYADRLRGWFTNGTAIRLPHRSHSDTDPCVSELIEAFIVSGGARPDASCLTATPPLSFRVQR